MSSALTLRTLLGMHPGTAALKTGRVASPLVAFDYADVNVINTKFKEMMRISTTMSGISPSSPICRDTSAARHTYYFSHHPRS